jgi:acyl-CoA synthetase (AMP-forming)/AMP-acid ligase II
MSTPTSRLQKLTSHFLPSSSPSTASTTTTSTSPPHIHTLSPTNFLPRAAAIEPEADAIVHITANGKHLRRSYAEFADRARGLAYFLRKHKFERVGILCPNTPAFLESIFGIAAAGGVNVAVNYRLKVEDVKYIFEFSEVSYIKTFKLKNL